MDSRQSKNVDSDKKTAFVDGGNQEVLGRTANFSVTTEPGLFWHLERK